MMYELFNKAAPVCLSIRLSSHHPKHLPLFLAYLPPTRKYLTSHAIANPTETHCVNITEEFYKTSNFFSMCAIFFYCNTMLVLSLSFFLSFSLAAAMFLQSTLRVYSLAGQGLERNNSKSI